MKRHLAAVFVGGLVLILSLQAQSPLTNDDISRLVKAGMSEDFILNLIRQQPTQFATDAARLAQLHAAGISERILSAMAAKNKSAEPLTTDGVIKLTKAGFSESFILDQINNQPVAFSTDVNRIVELKQAGVTERVIAAMLGKSAGVQVPAGTEIVVRMIDSVDSETAQTGNTFRASLDQPLVVNGETLAERGTDATIKLVEVKESGKLTGKAELTVELASLRIRGHEIPIRSSSISETSGSRGERTAKVSAGTAAVGAIIGAIAGGGKGAAIGAGAGAAAGAGSQVFMKGQRVRIPSETVLTFRLESPVTIQK
jgi:hypothetical protein